MAEDNSAPLTGAIRVDDQRLRGPIDDAVRSGVEETLKRAARHGSGPVLRCTTVRASADRRDTRAGHYERKLETKAGEVKLRVPKLHYQPACALLTPIADRALTFSDCLIPAHSLTCHQDAKYFPHREPVTWNVTH